MSEKTLTEKISDAIDSVTDEPLLSDLSDRELHELTALYWALQLDLQNEWVRRKMMAG